MTKDVEAKIKHGLLVTISAMREASAYLAALLEIIEAAEEAEDQKKGAAD